MSNMHTLCGTRLVASPIGCQTCRTVPQMDWWGSARHSQFQQSPTRKIERWLASRFVTVCHGLSRCYIEFPLVTVLVVTVCHGFVTVCPGFVFSMFRFTVIAAMFSCVDLVLTPCLCRVSLRFLVHHHADPTVWLNLFP